MALFMTYGQTKTDINIDATAFLTDAGEVMADRTALIFMLKSSKTLTDENAEYSEVEGANVSVSGNIITVNIDDYSLIVAESTYYIGVGIKFAGDTLYREIPLEVESSSIIFQQDVIRA